MKKTLIVTFAVAILATPIAALANQSAAGLTKANAARDCAALKAKKGRTAFAAAYATLGACVSSFTAVEQQNSASADQSCRTEMGDATFSLSHNGKTFDQFYGTGKKQANAYGNCVSLKAKNSSTAAQQAIQNPARACRAARTAMGAAPFALLYGTNANHSNAFGNCVSLKARNSSTAAQQAIQNPARTCRAARTAMGAGAFALLYGTNADHSNAFGKCVSKLARAQAPALSNAAKACSAEQSDIAFAAAHTGKSFAQFYGTNADLSNAFGQCVSQKAKAAAQASQQATVNGAKACYAERTSNKAAFDQAYGTGRNAFGKCVSSKASSG
jgi:hypothetical protein